MDWHEANGRYLTARLERLRALLQARAAGETAALDPLDEGVESAVAIIDAPPALEMLEDLFGLSTFESDLLLLCAAPELNSNFAALCASAHHDAAKPFPTFGLALAVLPDAHWSALTPASPLRHWRLIEIGHGTGLTGSPLRIDETILHYLIGAGGTDERLLDLARPLEAEEGGLVPSHAAIAERVARASVRGTVIQLSGDERDGKRQIAAHAAAALDLTVSLMDAAALPTADLDVLIRLWEREAFLFGALLVLDCDALNEAGDATANAVNRVIENVSETLIVLTQIPRRTHRPAITFEVGKPTAAEQGMLWRTALGTAGDALNGHVAELAAQFRMSAGTIRSTGDRLLLDWKANSSLDVGRALWEMCRTTARTRLDDLAQRIEASATWDDLVLPELQTNMLREIAAHVRGRATVYEAWGFGRKSARGLGISALFSGASGTGKTMAAEVLALELALDLYRIDLSQVISKYIGETEKNLRRVFDAAEESGAILLFDEADALFGKRSEVKDSHDRYANIEVSYLLQRMEAYRGLAILTTNLKNALDPAFTRRLRFIVQFPFPGMAERADIWRRIFPPQTPTEGLDIARLAQLNVTGGSIRNIALNAAFLAADEGCSVGMRHLLRAARSEYGKLEKPLSEAEIGNR